MRIRSGRGAIERSAGSFVWPVSLESVIGLLLKHIAASSDFTLFSAHSWKMSVKIRDSARSLPGGEECPGDDFYTQECEEEAAATGEEGELRTREQEGRRSVLQRPQRQACPLHTARFPGPAFKQVTTPFSPAVPRA